jgi:hypothetical protein
MDRSRLPEHILRTATAMVGACMTVISVVKLVEQGGRALVVDELLAWNAVVFGLGALLAYQAMRAGEPDARLVGLADAALLLGMAAMVAVSFILAYELF